MRLEHKNFKTPSNKAIELTILASQYHQEINAADVGNNDRFVVQEVIKEIASSYNPTSLGNPNHRFVCSPQVRHASY
jgi:replication factor C subunit 3/5